MFMKFCIFHSIIGLKHICCDIGLVSQENTARKVSWRKTAQSRNCNTDRPLGQSCSLHDINCNVILNPDLINQKFNSAEAT